MLQRKTFASWMVFVVVMVAFGTNQATADVSINEFSLARHDVFTELTVRTPGRVLCNHFTEEPKFGKPFRVVLDLCGAVHKLDRKVFDDLPAGVITRIRTSQYATVPQNVVRVVLDLKHEATYKVATDDNAIRISLVAPDEPEFEVWSYSAPVEKAEPKRPLSSPRPEQPVMASAEPQPTLKNKTAASPEQTTLEVSQGPYEEPNSTKTASMPKAETVVESKTISGVSPEYKVAESVKQAQSDQPVIKQEPKKSADDESWVETPPAKTTPTQPQWFVPVAQYDQPAGPAWSPPPPVVAETAAEPAAEIAQAESVQDNPQSITGQSTPPAEATESDEAGTELIELAAVQDAGQPVAAMETPPVVQSTPPSEVKAPVREQDKQPLLIRLRNKFFGSPEEEKVDANLPVDSESLNRIRALAEFAPDQADEATAAVDETPKRVIDRKELESKIASVDPEAVASGEAYADAETAGGSAEGIEGMGTPVEAEPSRDIVEYKRDGRRDPFDPLVEGLRSGLWTAELPRVDALRLVGILQDYDGSIALFEDMEGYGYILREGDPVKNGYLKLVTEDSVVFEVDDYGWVHTVALELRDEASTVGLDYARDLLGE